jgi:hypothetical protein
MKQVEINLNKDEVLQLKRGEKIRVQYGNAIITIHGPKKEK